MRVLIPESRPLRSDGNPDGGRIQFLYRLSEALSARGVKIAGSDAEADIVIENAIIHQSFQRPVVLRADGVYYDSRRGRDMRRMNEGLISAWVAAHAVVYQSEWSRACYANFFGKQLGIKTRARPESIILNGADPDWFRMFPPAKSPFKRNVLAVSRWRSHKRLGDIVATFIKADLDDTALWVAGDPDCRRVDHPNVKYLGHIRPKELAGFYLLADCVFHLSWSEGCANVLIESLCAGTPVVTNGRTSNPEVVSGGGGVVVEDADPAFEFKMQDLGRLPPVNQAPVISALRRMVESPIKVDRPDLHINVVAMKYLDLFKEVLR